MKKFYVLVIICLLLTIPKVNAEIIPCPSGGCPQTSPVEDSTRQQAWEDAKTNAHKQLIEKEVSEYEQRSTFRKVLGALGFDAINRLYNAIFVISGTPQGMTFTLQKAYSDNPSEFWEERFADTIYVILMAVLWFYTIRLVIKRGKVTNK